jgi:branched-chain amino acid transport system substrate-binding protein
LLNIYTILKTYLHRAWLIPALLFLFPISEAKTPAFSKSGDTIKIGLLIPDFRSVAAQHGAELAIGKVNAKGGIKGSMVKLLVKSMEGPWGTGSTQAVNLIFQDNVVALLGSHDGRNAHLVEQVSAKSRVVFLSAWSGDPTLAQAFVPWFFNCVYDDRREAEELYNEIIEKRKCNKIVVVSDNSYDSGCSLKYFIKKTESAGGPKPLLLTYDGNKDHPAEIITQINDADADCIIILVQPPASLYIVRQIKMNGMKQPVYCTMAQTDENLSQAEQLNDYGNTLFVSSVDLESKEGASFVEDYRKAFGTLPGSVAASAYDGMTILINAIATGGTEREGLQKALADTMYEGVTGPVQFDDKGNRKGTAGFGVIKNGLPVTLK